jgi:hypothetical protein
VPKVYQLGSTSPACRPAHFAKEILMARKSEVLVLKNVDIALTADQLLVENVPVKSYQKDEKGKTIPDEKGNPTFILYHVDIRFKDYEDILKCAVGKVKHTVGHAIKEKDSAGNPLINPDGHAGGRTVVDSTGYPPKSLEETMKDFATAKESAKTAEQKAALKKYLKTLMDSIK